MRLINEGAPIAIAIPSEGIGWDMEASAIIKGTATQDAAKALDWSLSDEAMAIYAKHYTILANPALEQPLPHLPTGFRDKLIDNNFEWAANNRARVLEEWERRYKEKSEWRSSRPRGAWARGGYNRLRKNENNSRASSPILILGFIH